MRFPGTSHINIPARYGADIFLSCDNELTCIHTRSVERLSLDSSLIVVFVWRFFQNA